MLLTQLGTRVSFLMRWERSRSSLRSRSESESWLEPCWGVWRGGWVVIVVVVVVVWVGVGEAGVVVLVSGALSDC